METCSPSKRRALAPLNANALASPKTLFKDGKTLGGNLGSPVKLTSEPRKRTFEVDAAASPVGKKACLERDEDASSRSHSPDTSSLFDTSANDASWTTITTEPDAAAPMAAAALERISTIRPLTLTREQAREKVEILRLRLSLANYKVRTGQTNVPLADLQARPLPRPVPRVRVQSPDESSDEGQQEQSDSQATEDDPQQQPSENSDTSREATPPSAGASAAAADDDDDNDAAAPPPGDMSESPGGSTALVSGSPTGGLLNLERSESS